jgi:hypothetical protein
MIKGESHEILRILFGIAEQVWDYRDMSNYSEKVPIILTRLSL